LKAEKRDLVVIVKSKTARCINVVRILSVDYYSNANAWMTCVIFNDGVVKWDLALKRKCLLLLYNCTASKLFVVKGYQSDILACELYIVNSAM
jgi:hypothetical protein